MCFCGHEPGPNHGDVVLGCPDRSCRLFLEAVENVNGITEAQCVDRAESVAMKVFDDLQYACMTEAPERFGLRMLTAGLREVKGIAERVLYFRRHCDEVLPAAGHPEKRLFKSL